jgi:predicted RNase H-like HicB family nuclease
MATQVWEWTFVCVTEGESREEALEAAMVYLQENADRGELEPEREKLLEERDE